MVGILLSFWNGLFSGVMLVLGRVTLDIHIPKLKWTVFDWYVFRVRSYPTSVSVGLDVYRVMFYGTWSHGNLRESHLPPKCHGFPQENCRPQWPALRLEYHEKTCGWFLISPIPRWSSRFIPKKCVSRVTKFVRVKKQVVKYWNCEHQPISINRQSDHPQKGETWGILSQNWTYSTYSTETSPQISRWNQ